MSNDFDEIKERPIPESRKKLVETLIENLKNGTPPWHKSWGLGQCAHNAITGKNYRGINLLSIAMAQFSDPRWCTFNQAKEKGWSVKKGSKGTPIEVFKNIDKRTKKEVSWSDVEKEMNELPYEKRREFLRENIITLIKSYYIFNAEQLEGIPSLEQKVLTQEELALQNARIEEIIRNSPAPLFYNGNGKNFYNREADEIHLTERNMFDSIEDFYSIALHEIGHSSGHSSRLNRVLGSFGSESYAKEELRAEIGSMFIQQDLGIKASESLLKNHSAYIQSWIKILKDKPSELFYAISDANKIAEFVCGSQSYAQRGAEVKTQEKNKEEQLAIKYGFSLGAVEVAKNYIETSPSSAKASSKSRMPKNAANERAK